MPKKKEKLTKEDVSIAFIRAENNTNRIKHLATAFMVLGVVYVAMHSLENIVTAKPDAIKALAELAKEIQLSSMVGYGCAVLAGGACMMLNKSRKKLIEENGRMRKKIESNDPRRSSSGLTEQGESLS